MNDHIINAVNIWLQGPTHKENYNLIVSTYGNISVWDVSGVTDMSYLILWNII